MIIDVVCDEVAMVMVLDAIDTSGPPNVQKCRRHHMTPSLKLA